jgi:hypothetical protein
MDEYLRYCAENYSPDDYFPNRRAAEFLLDHKWQFTRALDLLEQAKTVSDRESALQRPDDNLTAEAQKDQNEQQLAWDLRLNGQILRATQLAGRPDAAKALKPMVEGPPPTQGKLQSAYWWNRARLATLEGRKTDALAYYQLSLPDRPIRGGLSRLACGAVLLSPIDRGSPNLLGVRDGLRFFTRWVGKLLGSFPYAQNPQAFAHRLALAVRA